MKRGGEDGAQAVHLVGIDYFHPYPARGTLRQVPAKFFRDFDTSMCGNAASENAA
jgi:hypothetical protein